MSDGPTDAHRASDRAECAREAFAHSRAVCRCGHARKEHAGEGACLRLVANPVGYSDPCMCTGFEDVSATPPEKRCVDCDANMAHGYEPRDQMRCAGCESARARDMAIVDEWKAANGYDDLLVAYSGAVDERNALRSQLDLALAWGRDLSALYEAQVEATVAQYDRAGTLAESVQAGYRVLESEVERATELAGLVLLTAREVTNQRLRARSLDLLHRLAPETLPAAELEQLRGRDVETEPLLTEMEGKALVAWAANYEPVRGDASKVPLEIAMRIAARRPHGSKEGDA